MRAFRPARSKFFRIYDQNLLISARVLPDSTASIVAVAKQPIEPLNFEVGGLKRMQSLGYWLLDRMEKEFAESLKIISQRSTRASPLPSNV